MAVAMPRVPSLPMNHTTQIQSRHLRQRNRPSRVIWPSGKTHLQLEHVVAALTPYFEAMHPTGVLSHVAGDAGRPNLLEGSGA